MKYTVTIAPRALKDLEEAYKWLLERTPMHAPLWHNGLLDALASLQENPAPCAIVRGVRKLPPETRELLYGDKHHAYRILFPIRGESVWISHIRHAARKF